MHPLAKFTPCGAQTLSKMACRYPANYPKTLDHGKGGHVFSEGKKYIDLIAGLGAVSVGYCDPFVNAAIERQLTQGASFSLPTPLEYQAAKKLTELVPGTDMWKFGKNGTDGTVMAVRAARAYTGRTKIMTVGYNGCQEMFECAGVRTAGIPLVLKEHITKAKYNDLSSFSDLASGEYACVLMEPMVFEFPEDSFLQDVQRLCKANGTLFILDEVVTGGRFADFVAQRGFEIRPDLTVLSKGIANGLPLSAVGGRRRIMQTFERNDFFASGTFGGECISLAAFMATQEVLTKAIPKMIWNGYRIEGAFKAFLGDRASCDGYPTRLNFVFPTDVHKYVFWQEMCKRGVLVGYTNFIMASHTDEDVEQIIEAIHNSARILKAHWDAPELILQGAMPYAALRKT